MASGAIVTAHIGDQQPGSQVGGETGQMRVRGGKGRIGDDRVETQSGRVLGDYLQMLGGANPSGLIGGGHIQGEHAMAGGTDDGRGELGYQQMIGVWLFEMWMLVKAGDYRTE